MAKSKFAEEKTLDVRVKRTGKKADVMRRYLDRRRKDSGARSIAEVLWDILEESLKNSIN